MTFQISTHAIAPFPTGHYRASNNTTNIWSVAYGYNADDNIASITDLVDATRSLSFQYDGVDRLARVDTSTGATRREDYVHDLGGNRVRVERRATATDPAPTSRDSNTRTPGTNRIASMASCLASPGAGAGAIPAGTRSFTPDARGNQTAEDRPGTNDVTVGLR